MKITIETNDNEITITLELDNKSYIQKAEQTDFGYITKNPISDQLEKEYGFETMGEGVNYSDKQVENAVAIASFMEDLEVISLMDILKNENEE